MKKRRARRKNKTENHEPSLTSAEEQLIELIAHIIVNITFRQVEEQNKKDLSK